MTIVIIPCSDRKKAGGTSENFMPSALENTLSAKSYQRLLSARRELATMLGYSEGRDLGFENQGNGSLLMPAYLRYSGIIFTQGHVGNLFPRSRTVLVIISALYGLLDACDQIREYNLTMNSKVPNPHRTVQKFWQSARLDEIVCEHCSAFDFEEKHDLLTKAYRVALNPEWGEFTKKHKFKLYEFPGQGMGALFRRAEILNRILEENIQHPHTCQTTAASSWPHMSTRPGSSFLRPSYPLRTSLRAY